MKSRSRVWDVEVGVPKLLGIPVATGNCMELKTKGWGLMDLSCRAQDRGFSDSLWDIQTLWEVKEGLLREA